MASLTRVPSLPSLSARNDGIRLTRPSCTRSQVANMASPCWPACHKRYSRCMHELTASVVCRNYAQVEGKTMATYQVLLTMLGKLYSMEISGGGDRTLMNKFIDARQVVVSVAFISWLADQEAAAPPGEVKERLSELCHRLVVAREVQEQERFDQLHLDTVRLLTATANDDEHPSSDTSTTPPSPALITFGGGGAQPGRRTLLRPSQTTTDLSLTAAVTADPEALAAAAALAPTPPVADLQDQPPQTASSTTSTSSSTIPARVAESEHTGSESGSTAVASSVVAAGGNTRPSSSSSSSSSSTALSSLTDPVQYALRLSEVVTGAPATLTGYGQLYDAVIQAAPPVALSPEGLALAHKEAKDLGEDLKARRRRSVSSMIGRVKVNEEQAAQLLAGTAAARILDLLLSLPNPSERYDLLPDCFQPPPPTPAEAPMAPSVEAVDESDTDELWCTPPQLLSEIDGRIKALNASVDAEGGLSQGFRQLAPVSGELTGEMLRQALVELRIKVNSIWMDRLGQ